jgi:hypothetical protein
VTVSASPVSLDAGVGPGHGPLACGALGNYERERVLEIAALLGEGLHPAHEDGRSMLMLDREPLAWHGRRQRGLAWIEGALWDGGSPATWREAAQNGACGMVLDGRSRFVHSSVNGLAPIYWCEAGGGLYFASRIDPLAQTQPAPLSVDWDAWAAILALRYPLGERTPFAEIGRLGPHATIGRRFGRVRRRSARWPWAEIDPAADLETGADGVAAGIEAALSPLESVDVCPLSGGRDSRMLLCALVKRGLHPTAVTVSDDEGAMFEEDLAAPVAAALGVRHELRGATLDEYPGEWEERAARVEYQFVDHAWLVPFARRLAPVETPVPDGYAIDTLLQGGTHFYAPETYDQQRPRRASLALFEQLQRFGRAQMALAEPLRAPLMARARDCFLAAARRFEGHPSQPTLSLYTTRTVRGVSNYPVGLLGSRCQILTPGVGDAVATAALSVEPAQKDGDRLFPAVFERLAPAVGAFPSTKDTPRAAPSLPRRWRSPPALAAHRRRLASGPLADHLAPELRDWLGSPQGELSTDLRLGMEGISLFHAWWSRYRDRLREADARDLAG